MCKEAFSGDYNNHHNHTFVVVFSVMSVMFIHSFRWTGGLLNKNARGLGG